MFCVLIMISGPLLKKHELFISFVRINYIWLFLNMTCVVLLGFTLKHRGD